jgi:hypothetical protein
VNEKQSTLISRLADYQVARFLYRRSVLPHVWLYNVVEWPLKAPNGLTIPREIKSTMSLTSCHRGNTVGMHIDDAESLGANGTIQSYIKDES